MRGKIHIYTGSEDTFLLTKAVRLLKQRLKALGSDAEVEILEGRNHFDMFQTRLEERIHATMALQIKNGRAFLEMQEKIEREANGDGSTAR